jgi:hypothetical protein
MAMPMGIELHGLPEGDLISRVTDLISKKSIE